jgi:predicted MFS family arabinose efflux permease
MQSSPIGDGLPSHGAAREWAAVASVALGTFVLVTSEFLPVGLLTKVAADLHASEGATGLMMTTPAIVAAFAAPAVMLGARRLDRRIILWVLSAILVLSNVIVAVAPNLPILLAGRVLLGVGVGAFWSIGSVIAAKIVPATSVGRANTIIFAGISVGTVLGVPVGALIGDAFGWRFAFDSIAGFGVLVLVAQIIFIHRLPPAEIVTLRHFGALFAVPKARLGLLAIVVAFIAQFGAYTYMGAFLEQVSRMSPAMISLLLLGYGVAGFAGNFAGGAAAQRNAYATLAGTCLLLGAAIVLLTLTGRTEILAVPLVILWGFGFGALPIATQGWMLKAAPVEMEHASAVYISVLQFGLASGAFFGGILVDRFGLTAALTSAGSAALATAVITWLFGRDQRNGRVASERHEAAAGR